MQSLNIFACLSAALLSLLPPVTSQEIVVETQVVTNVVAVTVTPGWDQDDVNRDFDRHWHWASTSTSAIPIDIPSTTPEIPIDIPSTTSTTTTTIEASSSSPAPVMASPAPVETAVSSSSPMQAASLNSTNTYRNSFEASPLVWNETLAAFAQAHAETCVFQHSGGPYGENIYAGWPTADAQSGVESWGNEEAEYNWAAPGFTEATGHFTQLVWESTTSLGCALVSCTNPQGINNGDFYVCEYYPGGNVVTSDNSLFKQNVRKAGISARGVLGLASGAGRSFGVGRPMAALVAVGCLIAALV